MAAETFTRHRHGLALAASLALALLAAPAASARLVTPLSWGKPSRVDPAGGLQTLTCASSRLCVAADSNGNVLASTDPEGGARTWRMEHVDDDTGCGAGQGSPCPIEAISCPTTAFCAASDNAGTVFASNDPGSASPTWLATKVDPEFSAPRVACASASLCVAVDLHGDAVTSTDPLAGAGAWTTQVIDSGPCEGPYACYQVGKVGERQLDTVACPSASLCVAGDWDGDVLTSRNPAATGAAWSRTHVDTNLVGGLTGLIANAPLADVVCPSAALCIASDNGGSVLATTDPVGPSGAWRMSRATPPTGSFALTGFTDLTCPSEWLCAALYAAAESHSETEVALSDHPLAGVSWSTAAVDRTSRLTGLSCPSATLCVATDEAGDVVLGRATLPRRSLIWAALAAQLRRARRLLGGRQLLGGLPIRLAPPALGRLRIRLLSRSGAVLAQGQAPPGEAEVTPVVLSMTAAGRRLLDRDRNAVAIAEATFWPLQGHAVTAAISLTFARH